MSVDLFLNGPLGRWALDQVDAVQIGCVYSPSPGIVDQARARGLQAVCGDAASTDYRACGCLGLSVHYPYLLKPDVIEQYQMVYNIHPGLLPWGRCYYPVFWALWANEPCGCTLHQIDVGIDTGLIIDQREVRVYEWDTGGSLHKRVSDAEKGLFLSWWDRLAANAMPAGREQAPGGSFHLQREFFEMKQAASAGGMGAMGLLRLVRCLSHQDYPGLLVIAGGRRYEVSMRPVGWES